MTQRIKTKRLADIKYRLEYELRANQILFRREGEDVPLALSKPEATTLLRWLRKTLKKETQHDPIQ